MQSEAGGGGTVTVKNPLLLVLQAKAEKTKIKERRHKIRQERRRDRERRRHSGGQLRTNPMHTPPPPLPLPQNVSFSKANVDINQEVKILGPKRPWEHSGAPKKSSKDRSHHRSSPLSSSTNGLLAGYASGTSSDSEQPQRKAPGGKKALVASSDANGLSPSQQLLLKVRQQKQKLQNGGVAPPPGREAQQKPGGRAKRKGVVDPQQDKMVADLMRKVREAEGEEYLVESDLHEICDWLASLKLPKDYLELFVVEGFDCMATIQLLHEEDLSKNVGITKTGHRKKIIYWVHRNRPEGYYDIMSDGEEEEDHDDYNMMSEIGASSSDSSVGVGK